MSGAVLALPIIGQAGSSDEVGRSIRDATSHDLVIAVVGYFGSGSSWVARALLDELQKKGYGGQKIKMSSLIERKVQQLGIQPAKGTSSDIKLRRIQNLQAAGTELRHRTKALTAALAVVDIYNKRKDAPSGKPLAFVIDQLKHPDEVNLLRDVYGQSFYLVSIVSNTKSRELWLRRKYNEAHWSEVEETMLRDQADADASGQQVRKTLHLGDFFIVNSDENSEHSHRSALSGALHRFVNIVMDAYDKGPTRDERGMYAAWGASFQSSCLSRAVGAAILSPTGELIATGTNDVPKFGGGLYSDGEDHRCFTDGQYCRNDMHKNEIYIDIFNRLKSSGHLSKDATDETVKKCIEQTRVRDLIEFSRAVHAEMDALISLARRGGLSASGGTLYCTTYPCHSCARHIVAAGIEEVVYIEPYPKSMALELHADAIMEATEPVIASPTIKIDKVRFRLFSGVAHRRFESLFDRPNYPLKNREGKMVIRGRGEVAHRSPVFRRSFVELEKLIAVEVDSLSKT